MLKAITRGNRWLIPFFALLILRVVTAGCWFTTGDPGEGVMASSAIRGNLAYVLFDANAEDLLLIVDERVWVLCLEEAGAGGQRFRRLVDVSRRGATATAPYLVYDGDERIFGFSQTFGSGRLELVEASSSGTTNLVDRQAGERFQERMPDAAFFVPVMVFEQHYRFECGDHWFELTVRAEGEEEFRENVKSHPGEYVFELRLLEEAPEEVLGAPGYWVSAMEDGSSLWVSREHGAIADDLEQTVRAARQEIAEFFALGQSWPVHTVIGRVGDMLEVTSRADPFTYTTPFSRIRVAPTPRVGELWGEMTRALLHQKAHHEGSFTLNSRHPWSPLQLWIVDGLAHYFQAVGEGTEHLAGLAAYQWQQHIELVGVDAVGILNHPNMAGPLGQSMAAYLLSGFGREAVVGYATAPRASPHWETENGICKEHFGMIQEDILGTALQRSPEGLAQLPASDYVVTDVELVTSSAAYAPGFVLSPGGDRIGTIDGQAITVLELETARTWEAFSGEERSRFEALETLGWFPDGDRIAFCLRSTDGSQNIHAVWARPGASMPSSVLVTSEDVDSAPAVSPCGNQLAFRCDRTGYTELYMKVLESRDLTRLTEEKGHLNWPVWSHDGERLAFIDEEAGRLGVLCLVSKQIQWMDLEPHQVHAASRPRWLGDDEIILPVAAYGLREWKAPLSVDLVTGVTKVWHGADISTWWVEPTDEENVLYVEMHRWDPREQSRHRGIFRLTFTEREP